MIVVKHIGLIGMLEGIRPSGILLRNTIEVSIEELLVSYEKRSGGVVTFDPEGASVCGGVFHV